MIIRTFAAPRLALLWGVVLGLCLGCDEPKFYQCEGIITHDGQPVPGLQINFEPVIIDSVRSPIGLTDADGRFEMTTGRHRGVPPGEYKVHIVDPREADGRRTSTEPAYLYVIDRYSPQNSDYRYTADRHREEFEMQLDTRDLPAEDDPSE